MMNHNSNKTPTEPRNVEINMADSKIDPTPVKPNKNKEDEIEIINDINMINTIVEEENKDENEGFKTHRKSKSDRDQSKKGNSINTKRSVKLNFLDLSMINQPNMINAKHKNKIDRIKEINSLINDINKESNASNTSIKASKGEKHIKILEDLDNLYIEDFIKEEVSSKVITKMTYLLDWFPKFRNEFIKALKLTSFQNLYYVCFQP